MSEYIVRETGYPGTLTQEIVGELVRCKDCKHKGGFGCPWWKGEDIPNDWYCANGEKKDDE